MTSVLVAPPSGHVQASTRLTSNVMNCWRYGSWAIVGGYALALSYRVGLVEKLLPSKWYRRVAELVNVVKRKTEPLGDIRKYDALRSHLVSTYGWATLGVIDMVIGAAIFKTYPYLPMSIPVLCSLVPATIFLAMPMELMRQSARQLCFHLTWLAAGYTCGPLAWIAQDSLATVLLFTGCTLAGFTVPLLLTRGVVSYVTSAHLLSCALSTSIITFLQSSTYFLLISKLKSLSSLKLSRLHHQSYTSRNVDLNVLLTAQVLFNVGISVLHTIPNIYRFVIMKWDNTHDSFERHNDKSKQPEEKYQNTSNNQAKRHVTNLTLHELLQRTDSMKEAFCIDAGWLYVMYKITKYLTNKVLEMIFSEKDKLEERDMHRRGWHKVFGGSPEDASDAQIHSTLSTLWRSWHSRNTTSGVISSITAIIWYVKMVSFLQKRGNPEKTLDFLRKVCVRLSPLSWMLPIYSTHETR